MRYAEIDLTNPGFGKYHTDHMVSIDYTMSGAGTTPRWFRRSPIELDPSAIVLHYAQEVFEGLKALPVGGRLDRVVPPGPTRRGCGPRAAGSRSRLLTRCSSSRCAPAHRDRRAVGARGGR